MLHGLWDAERQSRRAGIERAREIDTLRQQLAQLKREWKRERQSSFTKGRRMADVGDDSASTAAERADVADAGDPDGASASGPTWPEHPTQEMTPPPRQRPRAAFRSATKLTCRGRCKTLMPRKTSNAAPVRCGGWFGGVLARLR
jgi:hypothetical protein